MAHMKREDILERLRAIHENSKELAVCGDPGIEPRAAELMALSWTLLWSESPFEVVNTLLDRE